VHGALALRARDGVDGAARLELGRDALGVEEGKLVDDAV